MASEATGSTRERRLWRTYALCDQLAFFAIIGGLYAGVLGSRWGAYVALGGFTVHIALHHTAAIVMYRGVMRRPWPKVAPLDDDDDF
jgi:hypothetical protein